TRDCVLDEPVMLDGTRFPRVSPGLRRTTMTCTSHIDFHPTCDIVSFERELTLVIAMNASKSINWDDLIHRDGVKGSVYHDPEIFQRELERIWFKGWVYVGHESE